MIQLALALTLTSANAPEASVSASVAVVTQYIEAFRKSDVKAADALMTPTIIWINQNGPRPVPASTYRIFLAVAELKVGSIRDVQCQEVGKGEVSCVFTRSSMFGGTISKMTERYLVEDGKITRVTNTIPEQFRSLAKPRDTNG